MALAATVAAALALALLSGCASAPSDAADPARPAVASAQAQAAALLARWLPAPDAAALQALRDAELDDPLRPSPAMLDFLRRHGTAPAGRDPREHLVQLLQRGPDLPPLRYDTERTRSAAEAFEARAGNCLSLVLMTAALARAMDLPVQFQAVQVDETWSRIAGLEVASSHVNLVLGPHPLRGRLNGGPGASTPAGGGLIVDFVPAAALRGLRFEPLPQPRLVALYKNNRAAEALAAGDVDDAERWARAALHHDPLLDAAWNTLAVVQLRRDRPQAATGLLQAVLQRDPAHTKAWANLAQALARQGRTAEAAAAQARLAELEPAAPFQDLDAGVAALQQGRPGPARALLERALRRQPHHPETHLRLAQALAALGETRRALAHLEQARAYSTTLAEAALYAAKAAALRERSAGTGAL